MATAAATGPARLHCDTADRPCSLCIPDPHGKPACFHPSLGWPATAPLPRVCPLESRTIAIRDERGRLMGVVYSPQGRA